MIALWWWFETLGAAAMIGLFVFGLGWLVSMTDRFIDDDVERRDTYRGFDLDDWKGR